MKKILMLATVVALSVFTVGCAQQKKVVEIDPKTKGIGATGSRTGTTVGSSRGTGTSGTGLNGTTSTYDNVDPYGSGKYGNYTQNSRNSGTGHTQNNNNYNGSNNGMKTIYFGVDKYMISADNIPKIITNAKILKKSGRGVRIEGHCDASGTDEYNYALGLRRAKSAKEALINRGVKASNIMMVSMGESAPECTSSFSSECFAKNRRVEFK